MGGIRRARSGFESGPTGRIAVRRDRDGKGSKKVRLRLSRLSDLEIADREITGTVHKATVRPATSSSRSATDDKPAADQGTVVPFRVGPVAERAGRPKSCSPRIRFRRITQSPQRPHQLPAGTCSHRVVFDRLCDDDPPRRRCWFAHGLRAQPWTTVRAGRYRSHIRRRRWHRGGGR